MKEKEASEEDGLWHKLTGSDKEESLFELVVSYNEFISGLPLMNSWDVSV